MKAATRMAATETKIIKSTVEAITASAAVSTTHLSDAFAVGADKKYSAAKALFVFFGTLTAAADVQLELQSDTTGDVVSGGAYRSLTNTDGDTITAIGTTNAKGHLAVTGTGLVEANFDLSQQKAGSNLKIKVTTTMVDQDADTITGYYILILGGERQTPTASTLVGTNA